MLTSAALIPLVSVYLANDQDAASHCCNAVQLADQAGIIMSFMHLHCCLMSASAQLSYFSVLPP